MKTPEDEATARATLQKGKIALKKKKKERKKEKAGIYTVTNAPATSLLDQ